MRHRLFLETDHNLILFYFLLDLQDIIIPVYRGGEKSGDTLMYQNVRCTSLMI